MLKRIAMKLAIGSLCFVNGVYAAAAPNITTVSLQSLSAGNTKKLSCTTLGELLKKAAQAQAIGLPKVFLSIKDSNISEMHEAAQGAPWGTAQLFKASFNNATYIIKEIKKDACEEIKRLDEAAENEHLQAYAHPNRQPGSPQFIFPISYIRYQKGSNDHYLVIMPQAKGLSLADIMKQFVKKNDDKKFLTDAAQAFYQVGAQLAKFHIHTQSESGKPFVHGDAHMGNIFYFYDKKAHEDQHCVTFIDNERISTSFHTNKSPAEDIASLCMKSFFIMKWTDKKAFSRFPLDAWYDLFLRNVITGYMSSHMPSEQKVMFYKLKKWITNYKDINNNNLCWYTDKSILGFNHKKYMDPIFTQLEESVINQPQPE